MRKKKIAMFVMEKSDSLTHQKSVPYKIASALPVCLFKPKSTKVRKILK